MSLNVLEIRNYLLQPDMREHFIDYFEANFITTQTAVDMHVLGQFRLICEPDHFVWIRGFENMQTRTQSLEAFYGGPVWKQHRNRANGMMIDSDNVHLLRPLDDIADFTCGQTSSSVAAALTDGSISPETGLIAVDIYQAHSGQRDDLIRQFDTQVAPAYRDLGIQLRGRFVAEMSTNTFPHLPAFQNEHEFIVITAYESETAARDQRAQAEPIINQTLTPLLDGAPETLLLSPTLRSPLRYK